SHISHDDHHDAADVQADRSGNDRDLGGNNASYRGTDTPMHVRHGGHPLENERELGDVPKLCPGLVFERHALGPRLDGHALFDFDKGVPIKAWTKGEPLEDRKSTRLNSSHVAISYAVFCLKKKKNNKHLNSFSQ